MRYTIQTSQTFHVTYEVEADNPNQAWALLISETGAAECVDQTPGEISGSLFDAAVEETF